MCGTDLEIKDFLGLVHGNDGIATVLVVFEPVGLALCEERTGQAAAVVNGIEGKVALCCTLVYNSHGVVGHFRWFVLLYNGFIEREERGI